MRANRCATRDLLPRVPQQSALSPPIQPTLERCGVNARLVALDRPGFGSSTLQPHRTLLDWPVDVSEAADQLGIDRFAILGVSGGGPYSLACGYALPDRVTRIGIVAGIAPIDAPGMDQASAISGPSPHQTIRRVQFAYWLQSPSRGGRRHVSSTDQSQPWDRLIKPLWLSPEREHGSQRPCTNPSNKVVAPPPTKQALYRRPWGFDIDQVTVRTRLWYGGADATVPASAGRWLGNLLPNGDFSCWPDQGHFTWMLSDRPADVINSMVGALR